MAALELGFRRLSDREDEPLACSSITQVVPDDPLPGNLAQGLVGSLCSICRRRTFLKGGIVLQVCAQHCSLMSSARSPAVRRGIGARDDNLSEIKRFDFWRLLESGALENGGTPPRTKGSQAT